MSDFESKLEETMGFGTGGYLDLEELRLLYYGRRDVFISFTDDGDYVFSGTDREFDRPDSIVCFAVNDVVGRKVSTDEFYANVFRVKKSEGQFINNINTYSNDDLSSDILLLQQFSYLDQDVVNMVVGRFMSDSRIKRPFERFWNITEFISKEIGDRNFGKLWRKIFIDLGYIGFTDQGASGIFTGSRVPATIYLDYGNRTDLDIIPIQKHRRDPRRRVRDKVDRMVRRMSIARNRVSKKRVDTSTRNQSKQSNLSKRDALKILGDLL